MIQLYEDIADVGLNCGDLQCMLTLLEYLIITMDEIEMKRTIYTVEYLMMIVRLFPRIMTRYGAGMTPSTAMRMVTSRDFAHKSISLSPYMFIRWFVSVGRQ